MSLDSREKLNDMVNLNDDALEAVGTGGGKDPFFGSISCDVRTRKRSSPTSAARWSSNRFGKLVPTSFRTMNRER